MIRYFIAIAVTAFPVALAAQNSCDNLLQHGINNITRTFGAEHTLVYKYFDSCLVDHNASSDSTVSAADGRIFGSGSGNLNISQKRERVIRFCQENQDFAEANRSFYTETQSIS